jgi:putative ABC transport system permease protein
MKGDSYIRVPGELTEEAAISVRWLFLMAWRDSRRNRGRLFLFISSVILGIAALVSTLSFGHNLRTDVDDQAKEMVGADLVVRSNKPLTPEQRELPDSLPNRQSVECTFGSMVYFIRSGASRLVQVRALGEGYPFYGTFETTPVSAAEEFRKWRRALVDKTLMLQYGAQVGDSIRIGDMSFVIAGSLDAAPGRNEISMTVAPPVYIPYRYLQATNLLQRGSRAEYQYYYEYPHADVRKFVDAISGRLEKEGLHYETVEMRKERIGRISGDLTQFLTLISFIALLLGCVGVASAVNIFVREKVDGIAVLRCLGLKARHAFLIYLIQVAGIGLIGSLAGSALGVGIQQLLPLVLKDILPVQSTFHLSWPAILEGIAVGMAVSILFALPPLLSIRKISPLYTLRMSVEPPPLSWDPLKLLVYAAIPVFITWFAFLRMDNWRKAIIFTGSLLVTFLLLVGVARLLILMTRLLFPAKWNYIWRQGLANLHRPQNQTLILIVTIGLGTAFIGTLYFVQQMLMDRVSQIAVGNRGNMVLFDMQTAQVKDVMDMARQNQVEVVQEIPVVTVRVTSMRGITAATAEDPGPGRRVDSMAVPRFVFERELRVTYRDSLVPGEKIVAGELGPPVKSPGEVARISLVQGDAQRFHLKVGDSVVFDVQGVPVTTVVGSLRESARNLLANLPVIFPSGVLEQAPQFHVMFLEVPSAEVSASFQRAVVTRYTNISVVDLRLALSILEDVLGKIGFVIRFMAGFSILTGVIVLIASVLISKFQRIRESVLLRTLGARRRQVRAILLLEYFFLGTLAAATGLLLALGFSEALGKFIFDSALSIHWLPVAVIFVFVCGLVMVVGWYNSRGSLNRPPLEVLRSEG